jgi:hypothetical protein
MTSLALASLASTIRSRSHRSRARWRSTTVRLALARESRTDLSASRTRKGDDDNNRQHDP